MAVTPRKGDAASVRRQSRQRLRSERRYRRNRFLRFYRHLVRTGSAFPRLPRRFAPRNDNSGAFTILTMACTSREYRAGRGMPLPYNGVYNRREYPEICSCQWRSLPVKGTPLQTQSVFTFLSAPCTNWKCLPEIPTSAVGLLAMTNLWLSPFYR